MKTETSKEALYLYADLLEEDEAEAKLIRNKHAINIWLNKGVCPLVT